MVTPFRFTTVAIVVIAFFAISSPLAAEESVGEKIKKIFSSPTPTPHKKKKSAATKKESESPSPTPRKKKSVSPSPTTSPTAKAKKKSSPTPEPSETPPPTPTPSLSPTATAAPEKGKRGAPNATLLPEAISGFENYPPKVQQLLSSALELTTRNLDYKSGSADPGNGGMDCSGFVYYVLNQNGVAPYVPDDSKDQ